MMQTVVSLIGVWFVWLVFSGNHVLLLDLKQSRRTLRGESDWLPVTMSVNGGSDGSPYSIIVVIALPSHVWPCDNI